MTSEQLAYKNAKARCSNPNRSDWKYYGGRGIKFLFRSFAEFFAELGPRPKGLVLDRKDNDGHYEKGNVRWVTRSESQRNQRHTQALRNVESGHLARLRTKKHQIEAGRIGGSRVHELYPKQSVEWSRKGGSIGGVISGRKAVESGHLARLRTKEHQQEAGRKGGQAAVDSGQVVSLAHLRWHVRRGIVNTNCGLCQESV